MNKQTQNFFQQYYVSIGILIIVIIGAIWIFKAKHAVAPTTSGDPQSQTAPKPRPTTSASNQAVWTGVLKNSDNPGKGNFMLMTQNRVIYIKTSRDFGNLVDKKVDVTYTGDFQNFVLGNIAIAQ